MDACNIDEIQNLFIYYSACRKTPDSYPNIRKRSAVKT